MNDDDDSDRTESYTPPPFDITDDLNNSSEKENDYKDSSPTKEQSIIVLDNSFDQITTIKQIHNESSNLLFQKKRKLFLFYRRSVLGSMAIGYE
jgi:hypothetical protein